ncbi:MAG: MCE family protein [Desulfobacteraceae bacterium]|nr:MCE family protein [Desulfobacteraceae bacterium]
MAKPVSKTVVGGFVVLAIIMLIAGVVLFGSGSFFKKTEKFILFFENSVKGLKVGSPVVWNGVKVGSVDSIVLDVDTQKKNINAPVVVVLDDASITYRGKPSKVGVNDWIKQGLRARMAPESLVTGQMMIELVFLPQTPVRLINTYNEYPEIPTVPSTMDQIGKQLMGLPLAEITEKLLAITDKLDRFLASPETKKIIENFSVASERLPRLLSDTHSQMNQLSEKLLITVEKVNKEIDNVAAGIARVETDTRTAIKDISDSATSLMEGANGHVQAIGPKVIQALDSAHIALTQAQDTLASADGFIGKNSNTRIKLNRTLDEISVASRSLSSFLDYLERHPEAMLQGKGDK